MKLGKLKEDSNQLIDNFIFDAFVIFFIDHRDHRAIEHA